MEFHSSSDLQPRLRTLPWVWFLHFLFQFHSDRAHSQRFPRLGCCSIGWPVFSRASFRISSSSAWCKSTSKRTHMAVLFFRRRNCLRKTLRTKNFSQLPLDGSHIEALSKKRRRPVNCWLEGLYHCFKDRPQISVAKLPFSVAACYYAELSPFVSRQIVSDWCKGRKKRHEPKENIFFHSV